MTNPLPPTEGKTRPVVPAEIIKLMQAYGDARADGHLSAPALGEVVVALRDWASAPEPGGQLGHQAASWLLDYAHTLEQLAPTFSTDKVWQSIHESRAREIRAYVGSATTKGAGHE